MHCLGFAFYKRNICAFMCLIHTVQFSQVLLLSGYVQKAKKYAEVVFYWWTSNIFTNHNCQIVLTSECPSCKNYTENVACCGVLNRLIGGLRHMGHHRLPFPPQVKSVMQTPLLLQ